MLIVILSLLFLIVGIVLLIIYNNTNWGDELSLGFGAVSFGIGIVALIVSLSMIIPTQITKDINYQNNYERREMLVYRLENQDNDLVGNELLYQEIRDFNEDLRYHKKYANNPWTNWFFNERNAELDYIDYKAPIEGSDNGN